jgi:hypothetical protein
MAAFIDQKTFQQLLATLPTGHIALGIDENTALVRIEPPQSSGPITTARWQVMGEQTVTVFERDASSRLVRVGEQITL